MWPSLIVHKIEKRHICYLPGGRSILGKTVPEVLKMLPKAAGRGQHIQGRGHSFFTIRTDPKPVNNLFIWFCLQKIVSIFVNTRTKSHEALPWPVGRYRRILPALTANQNAGFVTVPSENKIKIYMTRLKPEPN